MGGFFIRIAQAGFAEATEAFNDQVADFFGVGHAMEQAGMHIIGFVMAVLFVVAAAGRFDFDVGETEQALKGALGDGPAGFWRNSSWIRQLSRRRGANEGFGQ